MSTEQRDALPTLVQRFLAEDFAMWGHDQRCSKPTAKELADTQTALREYLSASRLGAVREDDAPYVTIILDRSGNRVERLWHRGTEHDVAQAMRDWTVMAPTDAPYTSLSLFEHPVARVPEPATLTREKFEDLIADICFADDQLGQETLGDSIRKGITHRDLIEQKKISIEKLWTAIQSPSLLVETSDTPEKKP